MAPRAGRLSIKLHEAARIDIASGPAADAQSYKGVVEIDEYGRLGTGSAAEPRWDQELTFEIGPQASRLKVCLYAESHQGDEELLGQGSYSLEDIFDDDKPDKLEQVHIPLVNQLGKANGAMVCSLRFFHGRTPGKLRDLLGMEYIDEGLVASGPQEGPKKVNMASPVASPRARSRATSPLPPTPVPAR